MKNNNKGFTSVELMVVVFGICTIIALGGLVYVAVHFLSKIW